MVTKGLSKFLMKLIHVKVKDLGWEPIGSEDYLVVKLRPSMIAGAVASGDPEREPWWLGRESRG
jgi:hypothetical protein